MIIVSKFYLNKFINTLICKTKVLNILLTKCTLNCDLVENINGLLEFNKKIFRTSTLCTRKYEGFFCEGDTQ